MSIMDFKDYVPPVLDDIETEYRTHILEDIKGQQFKFKHRVPTVSEVLRYKQERMKVIEGNIFVDFEKAFNFITDPKNDFNCMPGGLTVNHLTEESVKEVVEGFCKRV